MNLSLSVVVDIGFENGVYTVNEAIGSAEFCVVLTGRIERDLSLNVITTPAVSSGNKSNHLPQIQDNPILHCCYFLVLQII